MKIETVQFVRGTGGVIAVVETSGTHAWDGLWAYSEMGGKQMLSSPTGVAYDHRTISRASRASLIGKILAHIESLKVPEPPVEPVVANWEIDRHAEVEKSMAFNTECWDLIDKCQESIKELKCEMLRAEKLRMAEYERRIAMNVATTAEDFEAAKSL